MYGYRVNDPKRSDERWKEKMVKKGFTLIELLVVIAIIAMLLSIFMPSLNAAKRAAQSVTCKTNLHQWGISYQLYATDYGGNFPEAVARRNTFMESLRPYYENVDKLRNCPNAKKTTTATNSGSGGHYGATFNAWHLTSAKNISVDGTDYGISSYGENRWIRWYPAKADEKRAKWRWRNLTAVRIASRVPLLGDARWISSEPGDSINCTRRSRSEKTFFTSKTADWRDSMKSYMMRRHKDGINLVVADGSADYVKVEDLWTYKWHRDFKTQAVDENRLTWLKKDLPLN